MTTERKQRGHFYWRYGSWFLRYSDNVLQPDGTIRRKLLSKKLASGIRESKAIPKAIAKLADETLNLVNSGKLNVSETMSVSDFIEKHYLKGCLLYTSATLQPYFDIRDFRIIFPDARKGKQNGVLDTPVTVSYTHLDVYKRQLHGICCV